MCQVEKEKKNHKMNHWRVMKAGGRFYKTLRALLKEKEGQVEEAPRTNDIMAQVEVKWRSAFVAVVDRCHTPD